MKPNHTEIVRVVGISLLRFAVALVFIFSGFVKAVDPLGTQYKLSDYLQAWHIGFIPTNVLLFVAVLLSTLEFAIGMFLLLGIRRRLTLQALLFFMVLFTPITLWLALTNPISDCGCFGDAVKLSNWETFLKNLFLLTAGLLLYRFNADIKPLVHARLNVLAGLYVFGYILCVSYISLRYLPLFDFRPYRIGTNIAQSMIVPPGESPTEYETLFTLEKNGEKKEFTLDSYPDSTWQFVDSRTVVAKQGYEPPIKDFSAMSVADGTDLNDSLLHDSTYVFLMVAYNLAQANDQYADVYNEIYDFCLQHQYTFYCLTASDTVQMEAWNERTGADYPYAWVDDVTLRTMIRANPGLILLHRGVVTGKWSSRNLPDEVQLAQLTSSAATHGIDTPTGTSRACVLAAWLILPLLLLSLAGKAWSGYKKFKYHMIDKNTNQH